MEREPSEFQVSGGDPIFGIDSESQTLDLEAEFQKEPLKSVKLDDLKKGRTPEETAKLMRFLIQQKEVLSDGKLDHRSNPIPVRFVQQP